MKEVFGADLLPTEFINYDRVEMKFANPLAKGYIIPMVLAVDVVE